MLQLAIKAILRVRGRRFRSKAYFPIGKDALLQETGDQLLQENGDYIILNN